jgi:hypothetical protein
VFGFCGEQPCLIEARRIRKAGGQVELAEAAAAHTGSEEGTIIQRSGVAAGKVSSQADAAQQATLQSLASTSILGERLLVA